MEEMGNPVDGRDGMGRLGVWFCVFGLWLEFLMEIQSKQGDICLHFRWEFWANTYIMLYAYSNLFYSKYKIHKIFAF